MNKISFFNRFFFSALLALSLVWFMTSCKDNDDDDPFVPYTITIADVDGIPPHVAFDKVVVEITGACWEVIASVEAPYIHGQAVLEIPSMFPPDKLQKADWSDNDFCGHWPATVSDSDALVAKLGDFFAYNGDEKVGRIYLSDWEREESAANKAFVYYHYTDRPFTLSGMNRPMKENNPMFKPSYQYLLSFRLGWNAYANVNPANPGEDHNLITCTTTIPDTKLAWRFESYVY